MKGNKIYSLKKGQVLYCADCKKRLVYEVNDICFEEKDNNRNFRPLCEECLNKAYDKAYDYSPKGKAESI